MLWDGTRLSQEEALTKKSFDFGNGLFEGMYIRTQRIDWFHVLIFLHIS